MQEALQPLYLIHSLRDEYGHDAELMHILLQKLLHDSVITGRIVVHTRRRIHDVVTVHEREDGARETGLIRTIEEERFIYYRFFSIKDGRLSRIEGASHSLHEQVRHAFTLQYPQGWLGRKREPTDASEQKADTAPVIPTPTQVRNPLLTQ